MPSIIASSLGLALLIAAVSPADACSARGRFCGYPAWAANAFEDAQGRAPVHATLPKPTVPQPKRKSR